MRDFSAITVRSILKCPQYTTLENHKGCIALEIMILTAKEIHKNVQSKRIILEPYSSLALGTISYKFRIGRQISPIHAELDSRKSFALAYEEIPTNGYLLKPGLLYLAQTEEIMGSYDFAQQIFGIAPLGNIGVFIHISADLGHVGCVTQWTLEITTDYPVRIYPGQPIGQIIFWALEGEQTQYQGDYHQMHKSLPSKHWKELE